MIVTICACLALRSFAEAPSAKHQAPSTKHQVLGVWD